MKIYLTNYMDNFAKVIIPLFIDDDGHIECIKNKRR